MSDPTLPLPTPSTQSPALAAPTPTRPASTPSASNLAPSPTRAAARPKARRPKPPYPTAPDADGMIWLDDGQRDFVEVKFRFPRATLELIDQRRAAAGYRSRNRYAADAMLLGPLVELEALSTLLGRIGWLADRLLKGDDDGTLRGRDARKLGREMLAMTREVIAWARAHR